MVVPASGDLWRVLGEEVDLAVRLQSYAKMVMDAGAVGWVG
jgi:hypothetical protein